MSGWPDKPGVPLNPERDGWHWVRRRISGQWFTVVLHWQGAWLIAGGAGFIYPEGLAGQGAEYLGPCLTPAEVAAREAAAFQRGAEAMREAVAQWMDENTDISIDNDTLGEIVRALPVEEMRHDEG